MTTTATPASSVGTYPITASGAASSNANYTITYASGTLTVTPASLTVTASNKSRTYGAANPVFTASFAGFVNGDTAAALSGALMFSTTATASSAVGTYADHAGRSRVGQLRHHVRQRHADHHLSGADHHRERSDQDIRRGQSSVDGELQRLRQRRHRRHPVDRTDGHDDGDDSERCRDVSDHRQRGVELQLRHQLRQRIVARGAGAVDDYGQQPDEGRRRGQSAADRHL